VSVSKTTSAAFLLYGGWVSFVFANDIESEKQSNARAAPDEYYFDEAVLNKKGIDLSVINGETYDVVKNESVFFDIYLNGRETESEWVPFKGGALCLPNTLYTMTLILPRAQSLSSAGCVEITDKKGGVIFDIHTQRLDIVAPEVSIQRLSDKYDYGVPALSTNYSLFYRNRLTSNQTSSSDAAYSGNFDSSLHVQGWQTSSYFNVTDNQVKHSRSYVSKDFVDYGLTMKAGQLTDGAALLPGFAYEGIVIGDNPLELDQRLVGKVYGHSDGPATVKVFQDNKLLYETFVMGGEFEFEQINLLNRHSDLVLKIEEQNGHIAEKRHPVLTSHSDLTDLISPLVLLDGYQFSLGKVEQTELMFTRLKVDQVGTGIRWINDFKTEASVFENGNIGMAVFTNAEGFSNWSFNSQVDSSYQAKKRAWGWRLKVGTTVKTDNGLGYAYNYNRTQKDFVAPHNVESQLSGNRLKDSHSIAISYADQRFFPGSLRATLTHRNYKESHDDFYVLSYSRPLFDGTVAVNFSEMLGEDNSEFSLTLSLPLSLSDRALDSYTRYREKGASSSLSTRVSTDIGNINTSLSTDYNNQSRYVSKTLSARGTSSISSWSLSYTDTDDIDTLFATAQGGMVLHSEGYAISPTPLGDTFSVAKITETGSGRRAKGITLLGEEQSSPIGDSVKSNVAPYRKKQIGIDLKSLPYGYEPVQSSFYSTPVRGAVVFRELSLKKVSRAMVTMLPKKRYIGMVLKDKNSNYMGVIDAYNQVMLQDESGRMPGYSLWLDDEKVCDVTIDWTGVLDESNYYHEVTARCSNST